MAALETEDIMACAVELLNETLHECVGVCGLLRTCEGEETELIFSLGGNQNDAQNLQSRQLSYEMQDLIINKLDQLVPSGQTLRAWLDRKDSEIFKGNDTFEFSGLRYRVMSPDGGSVFDFTDAYHNAVRVHVKLAGEV